MKRALLLLLTLAITACGSGSTTGQPAVPPTTTSASPTPAALTEGDKLACERFEAARAPAARVLTTLTDPKEAALGPGGLAGGLLESQADKLEAAAVSASDAALGTDMRASGSALRQLQYVQQRPSPDSVQAFSIVAGRVTSRCTAG